MPLISRRSRFTATPQAGVQVPVPSGGGGASPISIPVTIWFDASDTATFTLSGSNVTQWGDKSGNVRHATKLTSPSGALDAVRVASVQNGLHGVRFDMSGANNTSLVTPAFSLPQAFSIHCAFVTYSGGAPDFSYICGAAATDCALWARRDDVGSASVSAGSSVSLGGGVSSSLGCIFNVRFSGTSSAVGLTSKGFFNPVNPGTNGINAEGFRMGAHDGASSIIGFGGYILEVFAYPGVDATLYSDSYNYLSAKWGIT